MDATKEAPDASEAAGKNAIVRTTINISPEFAEVIGTLARSKGISIQDYCDRFAMPRFANEYQAVLRKKLEVFSQDAGEAGA